MALCTHEGFFLSHANYFTQCIVSHHLNTAVAVKTVNISIKVNCVCEMFKAVWELHKVLYQVKLLLAQTWCVCLCVSLSMLWFYSWHVCAFFIGGVNFQSVGRLWRSKNFGWWLLVSQMTVFTIITVRTAEFFLSHFQTHIFSSPSLLTAYGFLAPGPLLSSVVRCH
jgi:hypothetical protein